MSFKLLEIGRAALVAAAICVVAVASPSYAAAPVDGGEWAIGAGETETLDAAATISRLAVDGSLTLGAGAALTANGAVVNCISTGDGMVADMTIANGAAFASQGNLTGANPGNTQGFSIGTYGGTGTVTVASGGTLTVTGGRLFLGRNSLTDANGADRTKLSHGVLNIFGTVTAPTIECGAWFPMNASGTTYDLDALPVASIINLEEGGVLETGLFQNNDASRNVINFKGGTLRLTREANPLVYASASTIWNIEAGKSLVFDSQSYHANLNPAIHQPDSFKITGAGGLVKKGTGYLRICMSHPEMNTFTGPIVVEEGYLSIGRPLAEGQTVLVKSGAVFYPVAPGDLSKITYENPADAPAEGSVYAVHLPIYEGLDLLGMAPAYATDKIATTTWGWNGEVHGAITHSPDISREHPFGLVGQGRTLTLDGTGLDDLPLTVSGTGTFSFAGDHTNTTGTAITFTGSATYQQSGSYSVQGENGDMPVMAISGGGTFKTTGDLCVGWDGCDGALVVSNGVNVTVGGNIKLGSNASTRQSVRGRLTIKNATVTAANYAAMGQNGPTDGGDRETLMNEIVLGPGALLKTERFVRNDDPRGRITFDGGTFETTKTGSQTFYTAQNGVLEVVPTAGNDINLNIGSFDAAMTYNHTHVFGDGGLHVKGLQGGGGTFTLGAKGLSDFTLDYRGATTIEDCTLRLDVPLPAATTVTGTRATLFLNDVTITNNVVGDVVVKGTGTLVVGADGQDCTLGVDVEGATVMKVGAGTLTLSDNFNGKLVVKEGTAIVRGIAYKSYRFKIEGMKGPSPDAMQLSELKLLDGAADVTRPYSGLGYDTEGAVANYIYPAAECPTNLVDGNLLTKWLDWRLLSSHPESDHDRVWLRIDCPSLRPITGYAWYTANDYDKRDPSAWRLQGSNNGGATWTDIDVRTGFAATSTRNALAGTFAGFGALGSSARVVVESGATLRVIGGAISATAIHDVGGTVELAEGAELVSNGGAINGGASGTGSVNVVGGNVSLRGQQSYTGVTHVGSGTLNIGIATNPAERASFSGKYFRLTIKRASNNGASVAYKKSGSTTYSDRGATQASEFQLYDADGNNVALGLTKAADGTAATALAAGTFATAAAYAYGVAAEGAEKLFDGNTSTKCNMTTPIKRNDPSTWRVITMRLADGAAPVVSYNFYTANDYVRRSPTDWQIEGSMDGIAWETLDERFFAPNAAWNTASGSTTYNESTLQYKPFNNGTPFRLQETMRQPATGGKFFRFTFKKTVGNIILQLSEIQLLDADGNNVARGLTKAANGTAATTLSAGSFADGGSYSYGDNEGSDKLFDDNPDTKMCAINNNMAGAAANYRVFTLRLADEAALVCGYNFVTANDHANDRSPSDWLVEGSEDGVTWTPLDERTNESAPFSVYAAVNHGRPYTFSQIFESGSIPADSVVTVEAGATLNLNDANATIGKLRVDYTAGGGTINSFRPAAGGTLELVNFPAEVTRFSGYEVPITVTDVQDAANLRSWTVTVNGVRRAAKVTYRDGKIMLLSGGLTVIVR